MERSLTPEERKKIDAAYKEADPAKFSQLPPHEPLAHVGETERKDSSRGCSIITDGSDTYVRIPESRSPARQQTVTRILKGIINVSDMVSRDGTYYSKVVPLEKIQERVSDDEIRADVVLLDVVFGDWDHGYYKDDGYPNQNMRSDEGKVAYYDFNEAHPELSSTRISPILEENGHSLDVLRVLSKKLGALLERYDSEEGEKFLGAILDSVDPQTHKLFDPLPGNVHEQDMDPRTRFIKTFIARTRINKAYVDAQLSAQSRPIHPL